MSDVNAILKKISLSTDVNDILEEGIQQEKDEPLEQAIPDNLSNILKGSISEEDLAEARVIKKQEAQFKEEADEIIESIDIYKQNPISNLRALILKLLECAEKNIVGKKQGKYREQIVFQTICKYFEKHNKQPNEDMELLFILYIEEIFRSNKKLLK